MLFRSKKPTTTADVAPVTPVAPPAPMPAAPMAFAPPTPAPAAERQAFAPLTLAKSEPAIASPVSEDERKRRVQAARRLTSTFGQIVAVMMRSEQHQRVPVVELKRMIVPALLAGQYSLVGRRFKNGGMVRPVTVLLWARVSDELDRQLTQAGSTPVRLGAKDWTSGSHVWLIDVIGDTAMIPQLIAKLSEGRWKGAVVKMRARGSDGQMAVRTIGPL